MAPVSKRMWEFLILALATVLVIAMAAPVAAKSGDPTPLPVNGEVSGQFSVTTEVGDRCDDSPEGKVAWAVFSYEGSGIVTHLGNTDFYGDHCSYSADGTPETQDGTFGEGQLTLVAANGDILRATTADGVSLSPPPLVGFQASLTFVDGGTGRFATASGAGMVPGTADLVSGELTLQLEGVISYKR